LVHEPRFRSFAARAGAPFEPRPPLISFIRFSRYSLLDIAPVPVLV
jgi:hypothetical protein